MLQSVLFKSFIQKNTDKTVGPIKKKMNNKNKTNKETSFTETDRTGHII